MGQTIIQHEQALVMYDDGANDGQIAARFGVAGASVAQWRKRHGLKSKHKCGLAADQVRKARKMLREGATKSQVAEVLGVARATIQKMRRKMQGEGLRASGIGGNSIRKHVIADKGLYPRILRAVGVGLPRDVRHDAASELYADVITGRLAVDLIESKASRYRNWAW